MDDVETIEAAILAQLREEYTDSPHGLALLSEHDTEETVRDILRSKIRELAAKEAKTRGLDPDSLKKLSFQRAGSYPAFLNRACTGGLIRKLRNACAASGCGVRLRSIPV